METIDKGSAVLIEVEFKRATAFGDSEYFEPTGPVITISDRLGTVVVSAAELIRSDTGKYYYVCQTGDDWLDGAYATRVEGTDGSYSDVTVNEEAFALV